MWFARGAAATLAGFGGAGAAGTAVAGGATGAPGARSEESQRMLKEMFYNKAVLFASCAAEAELHRAPQAPRLPANRNLLLTTCVEQKFAELNKFTNMRSYAGIFFPDRIRKCGEASRLREQEGLFAPYGFLQLAEPKLYNFAQYNDCLMKASTSPAAE